MSSTALKTLAVVFVALAVILAFVAYQLSQGLTEAPETVEQTAPEPGPDQVLAVVATARMPAYRPIPMESVALVPISVQPAQYYQSVDEVIGRTPLRDIAVGSPVTEEAFGSANTLAQAIPAGTQAMSLEITDIIAVGGFVKPGDNVDVLVYIRSSGDEVEDTQARVLLKKARLLAYEERVINASVEQREQDAQARQQRRERTAVIAVPADQTTRVMLGASLGELRLALHGFEPTNVGNTGSSEDEPEALAPEAAARDVAKNSKDDKESEEDIAKKEKVITLNELSQIKKKRKKSAPRPPPRATIEVFEGAESKKISRPY